MFQLIEFMNLFYATLDTRISKFKVYNVHTMADEFMVVSGMPNKIGNILISNNASTQQHVSSYFPPNVYRAQKSNSFWECSFFPYA